MALVIYCAHSLPPSPALFSANRFNYSHHTHLSNHIQLSKRGKAQHRKFCVRAVDQSQTDKVKATTTEAKSNVILDVCSGADVVRRFYDAINRRDLSAVVDLIAVDCVYEDLVFSKPFVGRKAILEFFDKFTSTISKDLQFVIEDISNDDSRAVGLTWHLEWRGKVFPFSKGCSFYRLDVFEGKRQIIYGRDSVEPFMKPGDEAALAAIRGVTWLLERFPQLADRL